MDRGMAEGEGTEGLYKRSVFGVEKGDKWSAARQRTGSSALPYLHKRP